MAKDKKVKKVVDKPKPKKVEPSQPTRGVYDKRGKQWLKVWYSLILLVVSSNLEKKKPIIIVEELQLNPLNQNQRKEVKHAKQIRCYD